MAFKRNITNTMKQIKKIVKLQENTYNEWEYLVACFL